MTTESEIVAGIQAAGRFDALASSEAEARRLLRQSMPDAMELPAAVLNKAYPNPQPGCRKWFQLHPPEPAVGNMRPHFKYADWTHGKKGKGGSWGHIEF